MWVTNKLKSAVELMKRRLLYGRFAPIPDWKAKMSVPSNLSTLPPKPALLAFREEVRSSLHPWMLAA